MPSKNFSLVMFSDYHFLIRVSTLGRFLPILVIAKVSALGWQRLRGLVTKKSGYGRIRLLSFEYLMSGSC